MFTSSSITRMIRCPSAGLIAGSSVFETGSWARGSRIVKVVPVPYFAVYGYGASVTFYQSMRHGKSHSFSYPHSLAAPEWLKNLREILYGYSCPGVTNRDNHFIGFSICLDSYVSTLGHRFRSVSYEIDDYLEHFILLAFHQATILQVQLHVDLDAFLFGRPFSIRVGKLRLHFSLCWPSQRQLSHFP